MKKIALVIVLLMAIPAIADTYVNGYTKSDGTYVAPHYRTEANSTKSDNYSTQGNINPYTGERGHVNPNTTQPIMIYEPPKPYSPPNPYGSQYR